MKYEALVKMDDSVNESLTPEQQEAQLYKADDIVVIKPKGWSWGTEEIKHFMIVELPDDITEEETRLLVTPVEIDYEGSVTDDYAAIQEGEDEKEPEMIVQESMRRRRHKISIAEVLNLFSEDDDDERKILNRDLEHQPFKNKVIKRNMIADKTDSKELQKKITDKKVAMIIDGKKVKESPSGFLQEKKLRGRKVHNSE